MPSLLLPGRRKTEKEKREEKRVSRIFRERRVRAPGFYLATAPIKRDAEKEK